MNVIFDRAHHATCFANEAIYKKTIVDSCSTDSGGRFHCYDGTRWYCLRGLWIPIKTKNCFPSRATVDPEVRAFRGAKSDGSVIDDCLWRPPRSPPTSLPPARPRRCRVSRGGIRAKQKKRRTREPTFFSPLQPVLCFFFHFRR